MVVLEVDFGSSYLPSFSSKKLIKCLTWWRRLTKKYRFTGTNVEIEESIQRTQKVLPLYKGDKLEFASSQSDRDNLWAARKEAIWAIIATGPENTQIWSTDVAVPISRLAEIVGK